jgi:hypothetical protein
VRPVGSGVTVPGYNVVIHPGGDFMRRALFPLLAAALAVGCGGPTNTPQPTGDSDAGVTLTPITVADLNKAIASHKGKVVLIDCWFLG